MAPMAERRSGWWRIFEPKERDGVTTIADIEEEMLSAAAVVCKLQGLHQLHAQNVRVKIGKFHSPDNSLLSFCSSPFKVEVQCQPQRGGTDRHEIHETAGCGQCSSRHNRRASFSGSGCLRRDHSDRPVLSGLALVRLQTAVAVASAVYLGSPRSIVGPGDPQR